MTAHVLEFTGVMLVYLAESDNRDWMTQNAWQRRRQQTLWRKRWSLIALLLPHVLICLLVWCHGRLHLVLNFQAHIHEMDNLKEITKLPTIYRTFFRASALSQVLSTTVSASSSSSGSLSIVSCWVLLSELSSMSVKNFLDTSLLWISESSWNFTGYHRDIAYLILLAGESLEVINASGQSFFQHTFTMVGFSSSRTPLYLLYSQLCHMISTVHWH